MSADREPGQPPDGLLPGNTGFYRVDARGAEGVLVGEQATQINYFYQGIWTDGVAPVPLVSVTGNITSPYRGLSAFGERDAALFFGRETAADEVLGLVSGHLEGEGLVVVSGVSGAGKSSLLRAGVLPRLRGAGLPSAPEAASWPCVVLVPGPRPLDELAVRMAMLAGTDAAAVRREMGNDPAGFALSVRQAALGAPVRSAVAVQGSGQRRVLFVVDQAEQLFIQCEQEDERRAFLTALHAAAATEHGENGQPAAVVVLVVRADFEARLADYVQLTSAVRDRYLLTSMTSRQLRVAITQPAVLAGSRVDEDLVQLLLQEVKTRAPGSAGSVAGVGAGVLPLLSHALDQAWRSRTGSVLMLADYERAGGIEGAVASSAQRAYRRLTPAQQVMARQVFTRLTATSSDGTDTAARAARADLLSGKDDAQARDVEAVLETFAAERLLTLAAGTVEVSHEALLTAWPLLREWLAGTHADRIIRTRLLATAQEWLRADRDPSYLYSGSRLEAARDAAARIGADPRHAPLTQAEKDFVHASWRAGRRRAQRRRGFIAVLLAMVTALAVITVKAVHASQASARERNIAIAGQLASDSLKLGEANITVSALESIAAWGLDPSSEQARYAMLTAAASPEVATITGSYGAVNALAFSRDGKILATGNADGTVRLWDVATGRQSGPTHGSRSRGTAVHSVAFSPDGKILATADDGDHGLASLWDVATGRRIGHDLGSGDQGVDAVAFSPDGKILATGNIDGPTQLWDVATGRQIGHDLDGPRYLGSTWVDAVTFSRDGKILATGDTNGPAQLWDVATGREVGHRFGSRDQGVDAVAFSPDGKILATGDTNGPAQLWDVATGRQLGSSLNTGSGRVGSVAFSPDGKILATGDNGGAARLWNVTAVRQATRTVIGISHSAATVAFSPDGKVLATNDGRGSVRLWNVRTARQAGHSMRVGPPPNGEGTTDEIAPMAFSPDGKILATGSDTDPARLWNVATRHQIGHDLGSGDQGADAVAFSPDGKILATGIDGGPARLWNVATRRQIGHDLGVGPFNGVSSVAFSPDGRILATGDFYSTARLWNVATGRQIGGPLRGGPFGGGASGNYTPPTSVAFSPDGKILATGDGDGSVRLWNVATGQQIGNPLSIGPSASIASVAFSPDGEVLAIGDTEDSSVRLWDVSTGQQIGRPISDGLGEGGPAVFSPDGKTLAIAFGRAAEIWDVSYLVGTQIRLCKRIGGSLTPAEWARYVPPGPAYQKICP